jgi:hypothetical protein
MDKPQLFVLWQEQDDENLLRPGFYRSQLIVLLDRERYGIPPLVVNKRLGARGFQLNFDRELRKDRFWAKPLPGAHDRIDAGSIGQSSGDLTSQPSA